MWTLKLHCIMLFSLAIHVHVFVNKWMRGVIIQESLQIVADVAWFN